MCQLYPPFHLTSASVALSKSPVLLGLLLTSNKDSGGESGLEIGGLSKWSFEIPSSCKIYASIKLFRIPFFPSTY